MLYIHVTLRLNGKAGVRRRSVRPVDLLAHFGSQLPGHGFSRLVGFACIDRRSLSRLPVNYARESVLDDVHACACANSGNNNATCVQGLEPMGATLSQSSSPARSPAGPGLLQRARESNERSSLAVERFLSVFFGSVLV
ncbi:hypothetical protein MRX96_007641 [Rhipicephalus microplus]